MSLSKPKYMPSYDFPEEILSEMFKRLPVKYVLRCLSVQKSWYNLIKSPIFVTLHLNHQKMTAHDNPRYLLFHDTNTHLLTVCSDDKQCQEYCKLEYPLDFDDHEWCAASNGLICISSLSYKKPDYDPNIYIWNPLVQIGKTIRESPLSILSAEKIEWMALAFGFLPEVNDYVVVQIVKLEEDQPYSYDYTHTVAIGVYSLNTGSWKFVFRDDVCIMRLFTNQSLFVNGIAFWVVASIVCEYVMYFDTKTEMLRYILVPFMLGSREHQLNDPVIYPFGQSVGFFIENSESHHLDIWVLKGEMIDEVFWEKTMSVNLSEDVWADVLGIRNNGDPILAKSNNLISYDLDTHEPYDFVNSCDRLTSNSPHEEGSKPFVITPFVETLLCFDTNTSDEAGC